MSIRDNIIAGVTKDLHEREKQISMDEIKRRALYAPQAMNALDIMRADDGAVSIIAEIIRSSPIKGHIATIPDCRTLASDYEEGGASVISVFTEQRYFRGSLQDLQDVRSAVDIPVMCKDFVITAYQVHEARAYGADLILLVAGLLSQPALVSLIERIESLGMNAAVEVHSRFEALRALEAGAHIIGVNAQDMRLPDVDVDTIEQLIDIIPAETIVVAESGVRCSHDVFRYAQSGADAVVIGEALARSDSPVQTLQKMVSAGHHPAIMMDRKARTRAARNSKKNNHIPE